MKCVNKQFRKRNAILAYLKETKEHPSAEMVYARLKPDFPDLSLGTVYRNLSMFKQQGVIASLGTVSGVERFDGNVKPHVHFVCNSCDAVLDLPTIGVSRELTNAAETAAGCQVDGCQLTFTGLCSQCIEESKKRGETA